MTLSGIQFRSRLIRSALTKPFAQLSTYPYSTTGVFDFIQDLLPELPTPPKQLVTRVLPDDLDALIVESSEPEVSRTLYTLARLLRATRIVEVGVFRGATSQYLAQALADNDGGTIHLVDLSSEAICFARRSISNVKTLTIECHQGLSTASDVLCNVPAECDLIYLDADHSEAGVRAELYAWMPKLRPGGILAVHDTIHMSGVCRAVHSHPVDIPPLTVATGRGSGLSLFRRQRKS